MNTIAAMSGWGYPKMSTNQDRRDVNQSDSMEDDGELNVPKTYLLTRSDSSRFESWLRRRHPGSKPGPWVRQMVLDAMSEDEAPINANSRMVLHLNEDERASIADAGKILGHRSLEIFIEELLLRIAKRNPDEIVKIFQGKPAKSVLTLTPGKPASDETMLSIGQAFVSVLQDFTAKKAEDAENDAHAA